MSPTVEWLLIVWGVITGILIILLIYRSTLTMQEDEQLFLDESASAMAQEQADLVAKVSKLAPMIKVLGSLSALMLLVIAGLTIYTTLNNAGQ